MLQTKENVVMEFLLGLDNIGDQTSEAEECTFSH